MTATEPPASNIPDNLPLLTQVVNEDIPDDLPTLTEVIAQPDIQGRLDNFPGLQAHADRSTNFGQRIIGPSSEKIETPAGLLLQEGKVDTVELIAESPIGILHEIVTPNLATGHSAPNLQEAAGHPTDAANEAIESIPESRVCGPRTYSEEDVQRLLRQFELHVETVFAQKLNRHLEELQKIAVEQAVNELKADLPELLRDALNAHRQSS